jgi:hypothetical protein
VHSLWNTGQQAEARDAAATAACIFRAARLTDPGVVEFCMKTLTEIDGFLNGQQELNQ